MRFTKKEKMMLFVFGTADSKQTSDNLSCAGCMAKEGTWKAGLWKLAERIRNAESEEYRDAFYKARMELEPLVYAQSITYNELLFEYETESPILDLVVQYLFGQYMDDGYTLSQLEAVEPLIVDMRIRDTIHALTEDMRSTVDGDTMLAVETVYDGHELIMKGIDWLLSGDDEEKMQES